MPDIFGRNPEDYQVVQARVEDGTWERHQRSMADRRPMSMPTHDFNAWGSGVPNELQRASEDQQALGFLTNNMLAIQTMIDEIMYTAYRLPEFVYINTNVAEGATSYGVRVLNRRGQAIRVSAPGDDVPNATVSQALVTVPMFYYGLDAMWTIDELRGAMMGGLPLDSQSIDAAVMGSLESMEEVALTGGGYADTTGLINHPSGTADNQVRLETQGASATFLDLTAEQLRTAINTDISWVIENSAETLGRNINTGLTVYLPGDQYDLLTTRYLGDNAERTIMRGLMEDNPWTHFAGTPINISRMLELDAARNPGSTTDQMVVGLKHQRVAEMGVSIMPRVITILNQGRNMVAQVESKYSDLFFKRPETVRYRRGI